MLILLYCDLFLSDNAVTTKVYNKTILNQLHNNLKYPILEEEQREQEKDQNNQQQQQQQQLDSQVILPSTTITTTSHQHQLHNNISCRNNSVRQKMT